jgi:L-amino acid N-acyltransferase YncA
MSGLTFRLLEETDWHEVARIYGEGIATGNATFETEVPAWDEWDRGHLDVCRLVAVSNGAVVAFAALSRVSARPVYRGVAEPSIYVAAAARGKRVGDSLLGKLVATTEDAEFWTLQTAIFPENVASVRLHERHGFRVVGTRERLGQRDGVWRDVLLMERRSSTVGIS